MSYLGRKGASAALTSADIPDNSITAAKIVDGAITAADILDGAVSSDLEYITAPTTKNITGTLVANSCYLSNAFVMTGDVTVSGNSSLAKIGDDGATTPFLTDTDGQTITGSGTLTLGVLVN